MDPSDSNSAAGGKTQNVSVPPVEGVAGGGTSYGWVDGGLRGTNIGAGVIDPTKVHSDDLLHVWSMPSTANVSQQEAPRPLEKVNLLAARNERESFQIALRPKVSWATSGIAGSVQIQCTDLCSSSGDREDQHSHSSIPMVINVVPGVPDALVPIDPLSPQISIQPGETAAVWVSVNVPCGQPPGLYEGEIFITAVKTELEILSNLVTLALISGLYFFADLISGSSSRTESLPKSEKCRLYRELRSCLDLTGPRDYSSPEEMVQRLTSASTVLRRVLDNPALQDCQENNGFGDMMDEDVINNISVRLKLSLTVWDFTLPVTPSLPAVFGVSWQYSFLLCSISISVLCNCYGTGCNGLRLMGLLGPAELAATEGSVGIAAALAKPAAGTPDHPKANEYYSDPRLAAYAVPYAPILSCLLLYLIWLLVNSTDAAKNSLRREVEILKSKPHWSKAYFYLWDEPLNVEQYDMICNISNELRSYAPDVRILTTYYCGPSGSELAPSTFEAFAKVPNVLRPHTQIFCTSEWVLGTREDLVKDIVAELRPDLGEEWWTYVCMGPSDPQPNWHLGMRGTQHRAVMWRVWKEGGTGFLYWGSNCYEKAMIPSAEICFRRGLPPGDGVLFYPGEVFSSSHEPVASTRLERILSGMQDIEYLKLYSSRYGREEGLALIEKTGMYLGPDRYTLDHGPVDVMRGEVYRTCRS
ncbi:hypothetical protein Zm00014a_020422 [Zea mays]|uniref:Glycoside hydrolase 123 catalytic domain-containing protein n=1 Tax=Zea mays TaxID=4577 RepID=A0A3L6FRE5_MAIZE|nr:hypothetical protein Zm00014a_020422 [Zea mays]